MFYCGNKWKCMTIYGTRPYNHLKIGGGWKRMVEARRISIGTNIKLGAPAAGDNDKLYLVVKHPEVHRVMEIFSVVVFLFFFDALLSVFLSILMACPNFCMLNGTIFQL